MEDKGRRTIHTPQPNREEKRNDGNRRRPTPATQPSTPQPTQPTPPNTTND